VFAKFLGNFVAQLSMVIVLGFLLSCLITKSPSPNVDGMAPLVGVPYFPFG
jgi:hypothetical protein